MIPKNQITETLPFSQRQYDGLVITSHSVKDAASKKRATKSLLNWQFASLTAVNWIRHLEKGHTIQPSLFTPQPNGTFTHALEFWQQTHFVFCDADNIKGVEFLSDGSDKNPEGIAPFTSETGLSERYPTLREKAFAIGQSVSSMSDDKQPKHRRYRLIFLFDEPITSPEHYHAILLALADEFSIIPPVQRSPAQPVLGNGSDGYNLFAIVENVLSLSDYPDTPPPKPVQAVQKAVPTATAVSTPKAAPALDTVTTLKDFLDKHKNIAYTPCEKKSEKYFVQCPYTEHHTGGICKPKDSYVFTNTDSKFAFHCSHTSCKSAGRTTWQSFKDGYGIKSKSYSPKKKLITDTEHKSESESINTLRLQNDKRFHAWILRTQDTEEQHILIISTGAGTGKTTLTILKLDKSVDISPIKELADAKYEAAVGKGKNAVRHRPRKYNQQGGNNPRTTPIGLYGGDTVPCVFPDHCNALAQRGYNPITTFCTQCPRKDECEEQGYLSQYRTLAQYNQIFFSWDEGLLTDPFSRKYIQKLTEKGDYVGVLDEVDPADLCPKRGYTTTLMEAILKEYRDVDCETAPFLRKFISKTSIATSEAEWTKTVRAILSDYDTETLNEIDEDLRKIPVIVKFAAAETPHKNLKGREIYKHVAHITHKNKTITCPIIDYENDTCFLENSKWILKSEVLPKSFNYTDETARLISVKTFIRLGFVSLDTPESINLLPQRLSEFTSDLKSFVDSTQGETPPAHRTSEGWDFYLPPSLNMRRVVFISASGVVDMIKELYKQSEIDIEVLDGKPPEWKDGCKLYQISTGRYTPNKSLIEKDPTDKYKPIGLKQRAVDMLSIIEEVATAAADKKILVVAPDAFTPSGELADQPELKRIHELPNVDVINHAHAEGVNSYEHHEISFVFGFDIPPDELKKIAKCIYRTETLEFEREKRDVKKGGVILRGVERYTNEKVQSIHDKTCESVLMQAITRQRQMLHANRICFDFSCEPVSGIPIPPILFTLEDTSACLAEQGNLDDFDVFLEKQGKRTVKEVAEQVEVTERTARRRTAENRRIEKAEFESEVKRLHDRKLSIRKIAETVGISRGKVEKILRKC